MSANTNNLILIVDDSPADQKLLALIVNKLGYASHLCGDGDEAILYLATADKLPVAALLDIHMPRIDGISLLGHMRSRMPKLPIMIVTGTEDDADIKSAANMGATWVIRKKSAEYLSADIVAALNHIMPAQEQAAS